MAQQINLYSPIFLAPQRHFSARAMAQSLGVFVLALAALCAWAGWGTAVLQRELQGSTARNADERTRLLAALSAQPASGAAGVALEQELAQARAGLARRRHALEELRRGLAIEGRSHAALLQMVAQTLPASAWLTELKLVDGRLELSGMTLQPEALQPWLARLAGHPMTAGQQLAAVRVERVERSERPAETAAPAWRFTIVSSAPAVADAGAAR